MGKQASQRWAPLLPWLSIGRPSLAFFLSLSSLIYIFISRWRPLLIGNAPTTLNPIFLVIEFRSMASNKNGKKCTLAARVGERRKNGRKSFPVKDCFAQLLRRPRDKKITIPRNGAIFSWRGILSALYPLLSSPCRPLSVARKESVVGEKFHTIRNQSMEWEAKSALISFYSPCSIFLNTFLLV